MKYIYQLGYMIGGHGARYAFVSSASFQQALDAAIKKIHRQHPSEKIEIVSFRCKPGDEVPDDWQSEDDYER